MIQLIIAITIRILSNSYLNVCQKILTDRGEFSSVVNFYTYLGLSIIGICLTPVLEFTQGILSNILIIGLLGAFGNFFIIKALSCGELSSLAPINSYKPVVALFLGIFLLKEYPKFVEILGIALIICGTLFLNKNKTLLNKATFYRFLALILSGTEAIFIKKLIIATDIMSAFLYWAIAGLFFSILFVLFSKHSIKLQKSNLKYQLGLILFVALMQYTTNYVFSRMNVAYALALFQLSTVLSVFIGINMFKEKGFISKLIASTIMIIGAVAILLA